MTYVKKRVERERELIDLKAHSRLQFSSVPVDGLASAAQESNVSVQNVTRRIGGRREWAVRCKVCCLQVPV
jgi:hypothetical protein